MAGAKQDNEFLDDLDALEAAMDAEELVDITKDEEEPEFDELDAVKAERDQYKDRFLRALADAENMRKRADRDRREAENYGGATYCRFMTT